MITFVTSLWRAWRQHLPGFGRRQRLSNRTVVTRWSSVVVTAALLWTLGSLVGCRSPDDLTDTITAVVIVVDVDEDSVITLDIADRSLTASPGPDDNVVSFSLPLAPGTHIGDIAIFEEKSDGELEPEACGTVTVVVPEDANDIVTVAVVSDRFEDCPEVGDDSSPEQGIDAGGADDGVDDSSADDGDGGI